MNNLVGASKEEFDQFITRCPLATPDGFKIVGSSVQTKYFVGPVEVARRSEDGFGVIYEINQNYSK